MVFLLQYLLFLSAAMVLVFHSVIILGLTLLVIYDPERLVFTGLMLVGLFIVYIVPTTCAVIQFLVGNAKYKLISFVTGWCFLEGGSDVTPPKRVFYNKHGRPCATFHCSGGPPMFANFIQGPFVRELALQDGKLVLLAESPAFNKDVTKVKILAGRLKLDHMILIYEPEKYSMVANIKRPSVEKDNIVDSV